MFFFFFLMMVVLKTKLLLVQIKYSNVKRNLVTPSVVPAEHTQ